MASSATIKFEYRDSRKAKIVARLLEIDNKVAPKKLKVETVSRGKKVITKVRHENSGTLFATVDDLIFTERLISSLMGNSG